MPYPNRLDLTVRVDLRDLTNCLDFDSSTGEYVIVNPITMPTTGITIEAWVQPDRSSGGTIFSYARSGQLEALVLRNPESLEFVVDGVASDTGVAINDGGQHHVCIVYSTLGSGSYNLFVDGKLRDGGIVGGSLVSGGSLVIGQTQGSVGGSFSNPYGGKVFDFRIWNGTLSYDVIYANLKLATPTHPTITLTHRYLMDEGSGTTATDGGTEAEDGTVSLSSMWDTFGSPRWVDIHEYIVPETLSFTDTLGRSVPTCDFTIEGWGGIPPEKWDEIIIEDGDERIFGGFVTSIQESFGDGATVKYSLGCSGYAIYLDHVVERVEYENVTDRDIIIDLIGRLAPAFGASIIGQVEEINTFPTYRINRLTIRRVIDALADLAGGSWYVDENADVFFFLSNVSAASYNLGDNPDYSSEIPFFGLVVHEGGANIANRIEVIGDYYLGPDETSIFPGDGASDVIQMALPMQGPEAGGPLDVWRNFAHPGENLVPNPRAGVNTSLWTAESGLTLDRVTGQPDVQGGTAFRLTCGTGLSSRLIYTSLVDETLVEGTKYTAHAMFRGTGATIGRVADIRVIAQGGAQADAQLGIGSLIGLVDGYLQAYVTVELDEPDRTNLQVEIHLAGPTSGDVFYVSEVQCEVGEYPSEYLDGSKGAGYSWASTAHASRSIRTSAASPEWVELTVLTPGVDELTDFTEVFHRQAEAQLEHLYPWPDITNAARVFGRRELPLRVRLTDAASFNFFGKWFDDYIYDTDITDIETARLRGLAELAQRSMGTTSVTLHVSEPGLRSGQQIHLTSSVFEIDEDFLIQRVGADVRTYGRVTYQLSLGVWNPNLIDILLELWRKRNPLPPWRDEEVFDEIINFVAAIEVSESASAPVGSSGPYYWAPAGTGNTELVWDHGVWSA